MARSQTYSHFAFGALEHHDTRTARGGGEIPLSIYASAKGQVFFIDSDRLLATKGVFIATRRLGAALTRTFSRL